MKNAKCLAVFASLLVLSGCASGPASNDLQLRMMFSSKHVAEAKKFMVGLVATKPECKGKEMNAFSDPEFKLIHLTVNDPFSGPTNVVRASFIATCGGVEFERKTIQFSRSSVEMLTPGGTFPIMF